MKNLTAGAGAIRISTPVLMAVVTGCATTTRVVPAGKDTCMVSAVNDTCGNCTPPEIRATQQARGAENCKGRLPGPRAAADLSC
jgi:hypothetical protein